MESKLNRNHLGFNKNADPFFNIIMEGLKGEVDGEHFWDAVAENAVFEFLYNFPGFTNKIEGRKAYMDWFGGYTNVLHSADHLKVYKDRKIIQWRDYMDSLAVMLSLTTDE